MSQLDRTCSVDGCGSSLHARGLCGLHYMRMRRTPGVSLEPLPPKPIRHGTVSAYTRKNCRCPLCTEATRLAAERYRRRYPERFKASGARYYDSNRSDRLAYAAAYRQMRVDEERRRHAEYAAANKVRRGLTETRRRARRSGVGSCRITPNDWQRLCDRYRQCCAYCGSRSPLTKDHVIPLARGGRDAIGNIVPACRSCNCSKGTKLLVEWRRWRTQTNH